MLFSSPIFVFGFLPGFLAIYYLAPKSQRTLVLLVASCVFYGWWQATYLWLVLVIAALSYVSGAVAVGGKIPTTRTWAVRLGVAANLSILGWFKYAYFLAGTFEPALSKLGATNESGIELPEIVLPIGLSFLVFQSISYVLDVGRGDAPPAKRLVDFLAFSTLFPQLIAGPILRYKDLAAQFTEREHSLKLFCAGIHRFVIGLAMKLVIADGVAPLADRMFALSAPTMAEAWLGALAYSLQLFFDFAGYSAMAIGLGLMIGFRFVENFDAPYLSRSVTEFWRRWHISLSNWLRDYLYVPLGGNRGGKFLTYRNLILTMVLGGLWHGANWTFVLWGLWHGGLMAVERALGAKSKTTVWPTLIAWPLTMIFVMIGWVMFRADNVAHAMSMYFGMFGVNGASLSAETVILLQPTDLIFVSIALAAIAAPALRMSHRLNVDWPWSQTVLTARTAALFGLSCVLMLARANSPFLYFQF